MAEEGDESELRTRVDSLKGEHIFDMRESQLNVEQRSHAIQLNKCLIGLEFFIIVIQILEKTRKIYLMPYIIFQHEADQRQMVMH